MNKLWKRMIMLLLLSTSLTLMSCGSKKTEGTDVETVSKSNDENVEESSEFEDAEEEKDDANDNKAQSDEEVLKSAEKIYLTSKINDNNIEISAKANRRRVCDLKGKYSDKKNDSIELKFMGKKPISVKKIDKFITSNKRDMELLDENKNTIGFIGESDKKSLNKTGSEVYIYDKDKNEIGKLKKDKEKKKTNEATYIIYGKDDSIDYEIKQKENTKKNVIQYTIDVKNQQSVVDKNSMLLSIAFVDAANKVDKK